MKSTFDHTMEELTQARKDLAAVEQALVNAGAFADGPQGYLKTALATVDQAIDTQEAEWRQANQEAAVEYAEEMADHQAAHPDQTTATVDVWARNLSDAELQALAIVSQAGLIPIAPDGHASAVVWSASDYYHDRGNHYEVAVYAWVDLQALNRASTADLIRGMIRSELDRISGGQGTDVDGVPFHPDGPDHFHSPTHQVTAHGDPRHLNFRLAPCWSEFHATLEYALTQIELPDWTVSLGRYVPRSEDGHGLGTELVESLRTYRVAAGDAADGECDCGKGDWCPQYGREARGRQIEARDDADTWEDVTPSGPSHTIEEATADELARLLDIHGADGPEPAPEIVAAVMRENARRQAGDWAGAVSQDRIEEALDDPRR